MQPASASSIALRSADSGGDLAAVATLFREYAGSLGVDLRFQQFDAELASLPGAYAPPGGGLWLAFVSGELAGCGAMRPLAHADHADACEMKRLYVRPAFRGHRLGRVLTGTILDAARRAGYAAILLDTLDAMEPARALYRSFGFREVPPYYANPIAGAHYLKADLT